MNALTFDCSEPVVVELSALSLLLSVVVVLVDDMVEYGIVKHGR